MRWSLKILDLDFVVQHRPGRKIGYADALSRHVAAIMPEYSLDKENRREQEKDDFCTKQNPGDFSSNYEIFRDNDGVMYRRRPQEKHQVVIPKTLIQKVLKENHDQKYAANPGIKKTYDMIFLKYWRPGMRRFIEEYIKKCDSCQRRKENREFTAPLGEVDQPKFFLRYHIDGHYMSLQDHTAKKQLFIYIDNFSKYVEAFPISI